MANYFSFEVLAPNGLAGIEKHIDKCELKLVAHKSGYNGKVILRSSKDAEYEWSMDSSDTEIMYGAGELFGSEESNLKALRSLSSVFKAMSLPHSLLIDGASGYLIEEIKHEWPQEENT